MGALARFEAFVESLVEGPFARLLGAGVQPVQIARQIERAMEDRQQVGPGKVFVPNHFRVRLNPLDFGLLEAAAPALQREMAAFVVNTAHERGFSFLGKVLVALESDSAVERRGVVVTCEATSSPGGGRRGPESETPAVERTQALNLARLRGDLASAPPASLVVVRGDEEQVLALEHDVLSIGRALDNDLVVEDPSVSRHHAEIRRQYGHHYLTDLQSTNGTSVNGKRVSGSFLQDGDRIVIGDLELRFQQGRNAGT